MVQIEVTLDKTGLIRSCGARGHAGAGAKGADIVCAAVSVLARSFLAVNAKMPGVNVTANTGTEGVIDFEVAASSAAARDFLFATGEYFVEGISSVAEEFPQNCKVITRRS